MMLQTPLAFNAPVILKMRALYLFSPNLSMPTGHWCATDLHECGSSTDKEMDLMYRLAEQAVIAFPFQS